MQKYRLMYFGLILFLFLTFISCDNNNENNSGIDVTGTWRAQVTVQTCSPSDLCSSFGLTAGANASAVMQLNQNGTKVQGTYTYEGAGITANVSGQIAGNQIVLDGTANHPLGHITVHLAGTVLENQMASSVTHDVSLLDGRSGTITGSGNFSRS